MRVIHQQIFHTKTKTNTKYKEPNMKNIETDFVLTMVGIGQHDIDNIFCTIIYPNFQFGANIFIPSSQFHQFKYWAWKNNLISLDNFMKPIDQFKWGLFNIINTIRIDYTNFNKTEPSPDEEEYKEITWHIIVRKTE